MRRIYDLANLILLLLTGVLVYQSIPRLPERVPMHFDIAGHPDRWSGRGGLVWLSVLPLIITVILYLFMHYVPRLGANARSMNIPRKEEFLKLPADKRDIYWAVFGEFFAGLAAATNLLFYLIIRGTVKVAMGERSLLPFGAALPALVVLGLFMVLYFWRLITLPGKLIRGIE
jgi:hypothetical protein